MDFTLVLEEGAEGSKVTPTRDGLNITVTNGEADTIGEVNTDTVNSGIDDGSSSSSTPSSGGGGGGYYPATTPTTGPTQSEDLPVLESGNINELVIPASLTSISPQALTYCSGLTSIIVEAGNTVYDSRDNCNAIIKEDTLVLGCGTTVVPSGVTKIGKRAFSGITSLKNIDISSITDIGEYAFDHCEALESITIPDTMKTLGEGAFQYCRSLTSIEIPANTVIEGNLFLNCTGLITATFSSGRVTIPKSVTSIGKNTFKDCIGLTEIEIPKGVKGIGEFAFQNCSGLTTVTFQEESSLETIGKEAFEYCAGLKNITIPNSVTSIGNSAFNGIPEIKYSGTADGRPWGATSITSSN